MIHVLFGLGYVSLTVLLLLGYCLVWPAIFWLAIWVIRIFLHCVFTYSWRGWLKTVGLPINRACLRFVGVILSALCVYAFSLYGKELIKWTGEGTAHHTAKVYFAAGQPLYGARTVLYRYFHPEHRRLAPLWRLQEYIYERAVRHLPEGDAEWAAWENSWFLYPYSRTGRAPRGTRWNRPSPALVALLDRAWRCLEAQATLPTADKRVALNLYMKTYPVLARYYSQYKIYYGEGLPGIADSYLHVATDDTHRERLRQLVSWLERLKRDWAANPEMTAFLREHPAPSALRDYVVIDETMMLIRGEIYRREFSCEAESVRQYIDARRHFVTSGEYLRTPHKVNRAFMFDHVVDSPPSNETRYILETYCGVDFPDVAIGKRWKACVERALPKGVSPDAPYAVRVRACADESARRDLANVIKILDETRGLPAAAPSPPSLPTIDPP